MTILSDQAESVELWRAPFFEQSAVSGKQLSVTELEAEAQARGFEAGREEGLAAGTAEIQTIVSTFTELADQMARPYIGLDGLVTKELAQMAMLLAEQIVRRELAIDSSVVEHVVKEAISTLYKLEGEIVIFVNPEDAILLQEFSIESLEGKSWKIVEDPDISPGGCQVKTPSSFVDASVEREMEVVFSSLLASCEQGLEP